MNLQELMQKGFEELKNSKLGQLLAVLNNIECTYTYEKYTIKIIPCNDIYLKISWVDKSINNHPYEVKFFDRVKGNTFKLRTTEYWELEDVLRYVIQNCDG